MRIAILCSLAACATFKAGPPPAQLAPKDVAAAQTMFPTATADTLETGRQTFLGKCNRCHKYPAIGAWTEAQWKEILPVMGGKAQLTAAVTEQTLQFVLVARASTTIVAPAPAPAP